MSALSTVTRKALLALTGLFLCAFLTVHLGGNLLLLLPPDQAQPLFNAYAAALSGHPVIKIIAWGLYAALALHIADGAWVVVANRRAAGPRPVMDRRGAASRWHRRRMGLLGAVVLVFLVTHLRDLWFVYTFGDVPVDAAGNRDLYRVVVTAFASRAYVALHLVAFAALGLHLLHGTRSAAHTLGLHRPRALRVVGVLGALFSGAVTVGFCAVALVVHTQH